MFSPDRWIAQSLRLWWPVFLIYNITWGAFGLVLLVPLVPLGIVIWLARDSEPMVLLSCLGAIGFAIFALLGSMATFVWTRIAIVLSCAGEGAIAAPVRLAGRVATERLGHVAVLFIAMFAISVGVAGLFSWLHFSFGFASGSGGIALILLPVQIASALVESMISLVVSSWSVSGVVAIVVDWQSDR